MTAPTPAEAAPPVAPPAPRSTPCPHCGVGQLVRIVIAARGPNPFPPSGAPARTLLDPGSVRV